MTVLTADQDIARKEDVLTQYPVTASEVIYKGAMVCVDTDGYLLAAADTAGLKFAGIAYEQASNASGVDAAKSARVYTKGVFLLTCTSITQAMVGTLMYVADDDVIDDSSTNHVCAGRLVKYVSATQGWVDIGDRASVPGELEEDLFLAGGGVINWAAGDVTITHAGNALTIAGGVVTFSDTTQCTTLTAAAVILAGGLAVTKNLRVGNNIYFNPTGGLIEPAAAQTKIYGGKTAGDSLLLAGSTGQEATQKITITGGDRVLVTGNIAITGTLNASGLVTFDGSLSLTNGNITIITGKKMQFVDSTHWIGKVGGSLHIATAGELILTHTNLYLNGAAVWIQGANAIRFNTGGTSYMSAPAAGKLAFYCASTGDDAFKIGTGAGGSIKFETFLRLHVTGGTSTVDGTIWYDSGAHKFKGVENGSAKTFTTS